MLFKKDTLTSWSRKQPCLPTSLQRASLSSRSSRHDRICSLPTLPTSPKDDFDSVDRLDTLSEFPLDNDLDRPGSSSTTLLPPLSPLSTTQLFTDGNHASSSDPESRHSFIYSLCEPGQKTTQRIQRLRARTTAVIMTLPATSEDIDLEEDEEPCEAVSSSSARRISRLRRVSGIRDLRRAFRDHAPLHYASTSSFEHSKASDEFGVLSGPTTPSLSHLSPRSSLRTLVDVGNTLPRRSSDLKTLCGSTLSSESMNSRFSTKVKSRFPPSLSLLPQHDCLLTDIPQLKTPRKSSMYNPSTPRQRRHVSLKHENDTSPEDLVWSCAKISQSAIKRAARRGHAQRRVFSNPIAGLVPRGHVSPSDPDR